jgi:hypothetical protein
MADQLPYIKNFDAWNEHKKRIEKRTGPHAKPGEIWWTYWGVNVGHEMDGKGEPSRRPVFILASFSRIVLAIPITSHASDSRLYIPITLHNRTSWLALTHAKHIDTRRLDERVCPQDLILLGKVRDSFIYLIST